VCESRRDGVRLVTTIVSLFDLRRRDVADRLEQAPIVEPIDPLQGGELDRLDVAPRAATSNDLRLVETDAEQATLCKCEAGELQLMRTASGTDERFSLS
jgi:hypothetical protein